VFAVDQPQFEGTRGLIYFPLWAFDFDEPTGVRDVIKANRAAIQSILVAKFGVGLFDPKIEQLKNALGGLVFNPCPPRRSLQS